MKRNCATKVDVAHIPRVFVATTSSPMDSSPNATSSECASDLTAKLHWSCVTELPTSVRMRSTNSGSNGVRPSADNED